VAQVVERALQLCGHEVQVFHHPVTALAYLQENLEETDLLLTDQTMPGMTGDLLAEAVHALRADLPVLIVTGFSHRLTAERIAAAGVLQVLMKPVDLEELQRAAADAISGRAVSSS
jgi:DNA-binding NtrC family response regulator